MNIKKISTVSILAAFTAILTFFPRISIPGGGYIHLGDTIIYLAAFIFGGIPAALAGAIGGFLSDIIAAPIYAVPTCIIKAIMGFSLGKIYNNTPKSKFTAYVVGGLILVIGYYITDVVFLGNFITPLYAAPFNLVQAVASSVISYILFPFAKKLKL